MPEIGRTPIKSALARATVGSEGARLIGTQLSGYAGATVQAILESLKSAIEGKANLTHASRHADGGADPIQTYRTASNGGTDLTQRSKINFGVGVTAADDSTNNRTNVTVASAAAAATPSLRALGTTSTEACAGNDARLSDARTPTAHAASHADGGSDPVQAYRTMSQPGGIMPQRSTLHIAGPGGFFSDDSTNGRTNLNLSGWPTSMVMLNQDVINNNATANTFQDVTDLSFNVAPTILYRFRAMILFETDATTTGSRWSCNGPAVTALRYRQEWNGATLGTTQVAYRLAYDTGVVTTDTPGAGGVAFIEGFILPSAGGKFVIRFASEVAGAAVTAKTGSFIEYW